MVDESNGEKDDLYDQKPLISDESIVLEVTINDFLHHFLLTNLSIEPTVNGFYVILNSVWIELKKTSILVFMITSSDYFDFVNEA